MAPGDKRKGTDTLTSFLLSSDLLPMLPLGDPEGFQFPKEPVKSWK